MHVRLGPQKPGKTKPPVATTWGTYPDLLVAPVAQNILPHQAVRQAGRNSSKKSPIGSISKRLDDMLSTPFCSHIIHYDPPRGFLVPKFSTYDGSTHESRHRKQRVAMQSIPRQPTRSGSLMVSPTTPNSLIT
ncbi:hypothetical protein AAG906_035392 [Vitis piasezkii]